MGSAEDELHRFVTEVVQQHLQAIPKAYEAVIVPGSYQPAYGTVAVIRADTAALPTDGSSGPLQQTDVILLTPAHLQQSAPIGHERVLAFPFHGGWACHFLHEEDDSPGAPPGEHWIGHRSGSGLKLTNDGAASGDGAGAARLLGSSLAQITAPKIDASGQNVDIEATNQATVTTPQFNVEAAAFNVSSGTITFTNGTVTFVPSGGGIGSPVALNVALQAVVSWLAGHVHSDGNGGGNTGTPTTNPPTSFGSSTLHVV